MDILESEIKCYDYFVEKGIKTREDLRKSFKTDPISGINQSFAENMFSLFKQREKVANKNRKHGKISQTFCISDMHIPNQDDKTCDLVFDCIIDNQPENLVLLGDIIDCYWSSRFLKNPKIDIYLQEEADTFFKKFSQLRRHLPKTNIYYVLGNHEDRVLKSQIENPQYIGLRALNPSELLRLDKLNIELHKNKLIMNNFIYYHGDKVRSSASYSAKAEFEGFQMNSGISGHTHRLGSYYHSCDKNVEYWFENGCLCTLDPDYLKPPKINWQQGFSVVNWYQGINQVDQILVQDHKFKYQNKLYS